MNMGAHPCRDCAAPVTGKALRCAPCNRAAANERVRRFFKTAKGRATRARASKSYYHRHRAECDARTKAHHRKLLAEGKRTTGKRGYAVYVAQHMQHVKAWRAHQRAQKAAARLLAKSRAPRVTAYPFATRATPRTDLLLAVNALVSRRVAARDDVCQAALLAILEGRVTLAQLKERPAELRKFYCASARENFELAGRAVSLDMPRRDGRSWHDMLPAMVSA